MKKILSILFIAVLGFGANLSAQETIKQTVSFKSLHDYSVVNTAGVTYTWASDGGTISDLSGTTNSQTIEWNAVGIWNLTIFGTDANGCITETNTVEVTVLDEAKLIFAAASTNQSIETCSPLLGGIITDTDFNVDFTGGLPPYTLKYKVTDENGTVSAKELVVGVDGDVAPQTGVITLSDFKNTTGANQVVTVVLISAITKDGASVKLGTDITRTITVNPVPTISTITLN